MYYYLITFFETGKVWQPKEAEIKDLDETENDFNDEMWNAVKDNATEEDLVEIAGNYSMII